MSCENLSSTYLKWVFYVALTFPGVRALVWLWRLVCLTLVLHWLGYFVVQCVRQFLEFAVWLHVPYCCSFWQSSGWPVSILYECLARRMHTVAVLTFSVLFFSLPPFKQNVDAWNVVLRSSFCCKLLKNCGSWCFLVLWRSQRVAKGLHLPVFSGLAEL